MTHSFEEFRSSAEIFGTGLFSEKEKNFFGHCASHSRLFASHCDDCDGDEISGRCDGREELNETESKNEEAENTIYGHTLTVYTQF